MLSVQLLRNTITRFARLRICEAFLEPRMSRVSYIIGNVSPDCDVTAVVCLRVVRSRSLHVSGSAGCSRGNYSKQHKCSNKKRINDDDVRSPAPLKQPPTVPPTEHKSNCCVSRSDVMHTHAQAHAHPRTACASPLTSSFAEAPAEAKNPHHDSQQLEAP